MITPGLSRINRLLRGVHLPWQAIHVAGTNGKGSICAYLSSMLHAAGIRSGCFTSPHLIDRWDGIRLGDSVVTESVFHEAEAIVRSRDRHRNIGASEFECLTATAFEIFARHDVKVAVIEAGMGGRFDATNVIRRPLVAVISKIGLDHQSFLGDTMEEIAHHKAGILKPNISWVVDSTNQTEVLNVLTKCAREVKAASCIPAPGPLTEEIWTTLRPDDFEPHQRVNLSCAVAAFKTALSGLQETCPPMSQVLHAAQRVKWPGRLQRVNVECLTGRKEDVLLDGAHNPQSAEVLASYVDRRLRPLDPSVTWLLAASEGKDLGVIFSMIRAGDNVVAVEFGPVDGMPWVKPVRADDILSCIGSMPNSTVIRRSGAGTDVLHGLNEAVKISAGRPLVIAGSLYLVSDVLRLIRMRADQPVGR
ncbi:MAG: folylpolyglutamate synthase [Peltula sp. TS41687]|nr:MAG: folylpolyglutamate synthase [Peltula sp. TS41687]